MHGCSTRTDTPALAYATDQVVFATMPPEGSAQDTRTVAHGATSPSSTNRPEEHGPTVGELSPEILERIFWSYLFEEDPNRGPPGRRPPKYGDVPYHEWELEEEIEPSLAILASVCHFWKDVVYGAKRLWTRIDLTQDEDEWRLQIKMSEGLS